MEFLAERFTVSDITFQFWMPIIVGAVALYILYLWKYRVEHDLRVAASCHHLQTPPFHRTAIPATFEDRAPKPR